jgi:hypothetical protein
MAAGERTHVTVDPQRFHFFDATSGRTLGT